MSYSVKSGDIEEEMVELGMGHYDESGEFSRASTSKSIGIKTLVMPDIEVSGGSINVSTGTLIGFDKLNASGILQIDVENNSNVYLVTNKLTIGDKGGKINFNGTNVTSNSEIGSGAIVNKSSGSSEDVNKTHTVMRVNYNYDNDNGYYIDKAGNYVRYRKDADGSIGTQAKPFTVNLTGDLLGARSNDEINLSKVGDYDFRISAIYSPKDVRITNDSSGKIQRSRRFDKVDESYINTPGTITLTGSAATSSSPMNILPHATTVVNLIGNADSEFHIRGVDDASKSITGGTMALNNINGHVYISSTGSVKQTATGTQNPSYLKVAADGNIILDRASNTSYEIYVGKIGGKFDFKNTSKALKATFTEETGGLKATDSIKLSSATFTHGGEIHTEKLTIETDNGVKINNTENTFSALEIASRNGKAINGSVEVAIKTDKFAPTIKNDVTCDVTLTNTKKKDGETINVGGTFKAETSGDFEYGSTLTAGKGLVMSNDDNEITVLRVASSDGKKIKGSVNVVDKTDMLAAHINNDMKKDLTLTADGTGNIELATVNAKDATISAVNGNISGDKVIADDTVTIELECGNLQLDLAKGEGVVILTDNENSKATVNTIRADSVSYDKNIVRVWQIA